MSSENVLNVSGAENLRQTYTNARNKDKAIITNQKESLKEILVFSRKVIQKCSGHMFVVNVKPKPAWHLFHRMKRIKLNKIGR